MADRRAPWRVARVCHAASDLLIRRSGHVVQDRPSPVVGWADIPELSTCVGCCSAAWLQSWLQSRRNSADPRPSAFRPDISPVGADRASVMRCRRSLLPAVGRCCCCQPRSCSPFPRSPADDSVTPWSSSPSPGLFRQPGRALSCPRPLPRTRLAAEPDGRRVLSRGGAADHVVTLKAPLPRFRLALNTPTAGSGGTLTFPQDRPVSAPLSIRGIAVRRADDRRQPRVVTGGAWQA